MIKLLAFLLAFTSTAFAGEVKLAWDPNPVTDLVQAYICYERTNQLTALNPDFPLSRTNYTLEAGGGYVIRGVATTNSITLTNVPPGWHSYVVTASNFWGESVFSNEAGTTVGNQQVGGVIIEYSTPPNTNTLTMNLGAPGMNATVETSEDVTGPWREWLVLTQTDPAQYVDSFTFTVFANEPKQFWRMILQ